MYFNHYKNDSRFYCDNGKVDWKSGFGIGLHIISFAIKMRFAAMGEKQIKIFSSVIGPWKRKCSYFNVAGK